MSQMHVLVTGGAGYIGSVLLQTLLQSGHSVTCVDVLRYGDHNLLHLLGNPAFTFVRGDVRDERLMKKLISKADVILPLAALVGVGACDLDSALTREVNLDAVRFVNAQRSLSQLLVYPNTNSGYGALSGEIYCTEETPLQPISHYGRTKVHAEEDVLSRTNSISLRLATVFGLSSRIRLDLLVNHFVHAALRDGYIVIYEKDAKRNYVHIEDVADCFLFCIEHAHRMIGQSFNLGLDEANLSKEQLALEVKKYVPKLFVHYSEFNYDPDRRNYIVSNEKLAKHGFAAKRTLGLGIQQLIKGLSSLPRGPYRNA